MHFSKIAIVLAPLIGLSAARPPHRPSPSGSIPPLPSFSPFPSVSPPPLPSVTLPPPGQSGFPGGPFEKREEDFQLHHHHRPHPSGRPRPSGRPHPSGRPQPSSSSLPPPQLDLAFQVEILRSAMAVSITTDLTHLADLILLVALNQAALVCLHHLWDLSFPADLTHLAGLTHRGRLCHRLCPRACLIPNPVERLLFDLYSSIW